MLDKNIINNDNNDNSLIKNFPRYKNKSVFSQKARLLQMHGHSPQGRTAHCEGCCGWRCGDGITGALPKKLWVGGRQDVGLILRQNISSNIDIIPNAVDQTKKICTRTICQYPHFIC